MPFYASRRAVLSWPAFGWVLKAADSPPERAKQMITGLKEAQKAPGMAAAVWKRDALVWSGTLGDADLENHVAVSAQTRFRIGSLSKLLTAAAAARLYDRGALDLDAPVQQYVPTFPEKSGKITARLLLGHLAGMPHYGQNDYINRQSYASVGEALKSIQNAALLSEPGSKYFYSSYGFNLLGAVLEGAGKADFPGIVRQEVSEPLRLNLTTPDENEKIVAGRTRFYSLAREQVVHAPYTDLSDRWPSGGFLSTAEELARFGAAHLGGGFLRSETRQAMFTSQKTLDGRETGVGFAWRIGMVNNRRIYHHGGDAVGGRAFLLLRPEDSMAVSLLMNLTFARFAEAQAMALGDLFV